MKTLWTFPGKIGDTLLQWPVAMHWALKHGEKIDVRISEGVEPIGNLLASQSVVNDLKVATGRIISYNCGGQPWDFDYKPEDTTEYEQVFHCGFRRFPDKQITLFTRDALSLQEDLVDGLFGYQTILAGQVDPKRRLVIHGRRISQSGGDCLFWGVMKNLLANGIADRFDEIVAVGTRDERLDARSRLNVQSTWADNGDWSALALYLANSALLIDAGTGVAALAGAVGTPCIRIHDPIGLQPKTIWSNPQYNQLNFAEGELLSDIWNYIDTWVPK